MATTLLVSHMHVPACLDNYGDEGDWKVDGLQVSEELYTLCTALRKRHAFRHCLFGVPHDDRANNLNVWVYAPDELFARGVIGYGDVGIMATTYKYYVETEQLRNYKVKTGRRQHNMLCSEKLEKIITLAKQHLRPYGTERIVSLTSHNLTHSLSKEKDNVTLNESNAMSSLTEMLTRNGALTAELVNMVKADYTFKDGEVRNAIVNYMDTIDDEIEVSSRNISITLVLIHPPHASGAEHVITVQRGTSHLNLRRRLYNSDVDRAFRDSTIEKFTPTTLPDDLRQKVSSLNILDPNSYVDGLGMRQSENIYYLAEDV